MLDAEVGDDVWGDDPTVQALESQVAALLGKDAAVFVSSGTQSNLVGLLAHCERGDEYIVGQNAHTYKYEAGGAAVLGSIQPQPIEFAPDGTLPLKAVEAKIKPDDIHFARSRLLAIENTHDGKVLPQTYLDSLRPFVDDHGLGLHLDGARLWNASVASGVSLADLATPFDTVSVCFSKGLGAPVGSALVGTPELITRARRWRKMLGGAMRQVGILAAGAAHALDHHIDRLADDHKRAKRLAEGLDAVDGFSAEVAQVQTNMVFVAVDPSRDGTAWEKHLADNGVLISAGPTTRLVTHLDIDDADIEQMIAATASL